MHFHCRIFITKRKKEKSPDIYAIHRIENEERGRETERVHLACGGHYFWCAPRLGELENIILSGWFDSAMKNVRSGDDKSWCWGEETGRQGMSFVMSAIWLHPLSPHLLPICLLSHISPFLVRLNFLLFYLSCVPVYLFYLDTIYLLGFFYTLWCIIILHTLAAMPLLQLYPIFTHFWLLLFLNNLFTCSLSKRHLSLTLPTSSASSSSITSSKLFPANNEDSNDNRCKTRAENRRQETKNVNALKRNAHMTRMPNVKPADISPVLSCAQCSSDLQRNDSNASGSIIIAGHFLLERLIEFWQLAKYKVFLIALV